MVLTNKRPITIMMVFIPVMPLEQWREGRNNNAAIRKEIQNLTLTQIILDKKQTSMMRYWIVKYSPM